jgi:flavin reductase (DIM6/NTAB) family NADH-FMN oxidoreductase RutF
MFFDLETLGARAAHKLLTSTIVPRPIAWVVTQNATGVVNAAPFSFFNMFSADPPVVCLGVGARAPGRPKDTALNVSQTGEFVVNLVSEALAPRMNVTAVDFPYGVEELEQAGLTRAASQKVKPPRIAESPVSLECTRIEILSLGPDNALIVGRVVAVHIHDEFVLDAERCHVDTPELRLVGRMHGGGWYVRVSDTFEMPRLSHAARATDG